MPKTTNFVKNECIFEVRYKPNAKLLDHRGVWAEKIAQHLKLEHWQIVENRIDVFSEDRNTHAFLGFRNGGLTLLDVPNKEYFENYSRNLLEFIFALENFGNPIYIERIGVRCMFCTPFWGSFSELRDRFSTRYLNITKQGIEAIGSDAKLIDIGAPLDFTDSIGNFKTLFGPMQGEQFGDFFTRKGEFPSVGTFYNIDYSSHPQKQLTGIQVIETIREFLDAGWDRHARVRDLLIKR